MQVRELLQKLQAMPLDAVVVIDGDVIHDVDVRHGTLATGYFNAVFRFDPHGKDRALVFLANTELSNGEVVSVPK